MAEKLGKVEVDITSNSKKLKKEMKGLKGHVDKEGKKMSKGFAQSWVKGLALVTAAFMVLRKGIKFLSESVKLHIFQAKAMAQVTQAVKQTGKAAGFSAKELFKMASELQQITGLGDEAILTGVTKQLLTFTNITGTAFKRAQVAVMDLNAVIAGGETSALTTQAIQLGKALEDPIRGVSALARSGITFTDQQKDQIKAMVEANDLFGAQSIILTEVENKYGGQAKALGDATKGLKQAEAAWGDFKELIGGVLLPIIGKIALGFTNLLKIFKPQKTAMDELSGAARRNLIEFNVLIRTYDRLREKVNKNTGETKHYKDIIDKLNKKYPDYLKNINLEKDAYERIAVAVEKARKSLEEKVRSEAAKGAQLDVYNEIAKLLQEQIELNDEISVKEEKVKKAKKGTSNVISSTGAFQNISAGKIFNMERKIGKMKNDVLDKSIKIVEQQEKLNRFMEKFGDLITETEKVKEGGSKKTKTMTEKQMAANAKYYETLKFRAAGYFDYRVKLINDEYQQFVIATQDTVKAEALKYESMKELYREYIKFITSLEPETRVPKPGEKPELPAGPKPIVKLSTDDKAWYDAIKDYALETWVFIADEYNVAQQLQMSATDAFYDGVMELFDETRNESKDAWQVMADTFKLAIQRMIADLIAMQLVALATKAILAGLGFGGGILGSIFGTGTVSTGKVLGSGIGGAHEGGTFAGTPLGIKKMADGGNFIVPPGFPHDSYPLMVESGEKVSVVPSGGTGQQEKLLAKIDSSIQAMNMNMVELERRQNVLIDVTGNLKGRDLELAVEKSEKIYDRVH